MRKLVLAVLVAALLAAAGSASASALTIGQTVTPDVLGTCDPAAAVVQTGVASGASYTVPAGSWILTQWSTVANASGGSMSLLILRPTATAGSYLVVAASPVMT